MFSKLWEADQYMRHWIGGAHLCCQASQHICTIRRIIVRFLYQTITIYDVDSRVYVSIDGWSPVLIDWFSALAALYLPLADTF